MELIELKAEVYDLIIKQNELQKEINDISKLINIKSAEISKMTNE